jgi:cold shock protein
LTEEVGDDDGEWYVKWFNAQKGYGFIQPSGGGGRDVFVHISVVERAGFSALNRGKKGGVRNRANRDKKSAVTLKVS